MKIRMGWTSAVCAMLATLIAMPVAGDTVAEFSFDQLAVGVNNSPAASAGVAALTSIGMTNSFTTPASVTNCDIVAQTGTSNSDPLNKTWRIRGGGTGSGNGWAAAAPQYSQGLEALVGTTGFGGITLTYDWSSTTQGVKHQQVLYTVDGTNWNTIGPVLTAGPTEGWINGILIDFSSIAGVDNNPLFGVRITSAFAPDGPNQGQYVNLAGNVINSTSGNWRVDSLVFSGNAIPEPASGAVIAGLVTLAAFFRSGRRA